MTEGRLQVFYTIADHKPISLYQLAQVLKRDQSNVLRDVKTLEAMKLVNDFLRLKVIYFPLRWRKVKPLQSLGAFWAEHQFSLEHVFQFRRCWIM